MINLTFRQNKNVENKYMKVVFNRLPLWKIEKFALNINGIEGCKVIHHRQGCVFLYVYAAYDIEPVIAEIQNIACEMNL